MKKIKLYLPIIIVFLEACAISMSLQLAGGSVDWHGFMNIAMGMFLCLLAMLKLFDTKGFATAFQKYDLIAQRNRFYALLYPFIELALGFAYLASLDPLAVNIITLVLMLIGIIGVWRALRLGLDIRCACLGTALNLPLSTVTIVENLSMAVMATANLCFLAF
jgi:hypothetical protein